MNVERVKTLASIAGINRKITQEYNSLSQFHLQKYFFYSQTREYKMDLIRVSIPSLKFLEFGQLNDKDIDYFYSAQRARLF